MVVQNGRTSASAARPAAAAGGPQPWTTARCHRLLRPLASKLQALRSTLQVAPSTSRNSSGSASKPVDFAERAYHPAKGELENKPRRPRSSEGSRAAATFFRDSRRRRQLRTYSTNANGSGSRSTSAQPAASALDQDAPLPNPDAPSVVIPAPPDDDNTKRKQRWLGLSQDAPDLLECLRRHVDPAIFYIYTGIYQSFDALLSSTQDPAGPQSGPASLKTLAARKLAFCILATEAETNSDDVWYDAAAETGVGGEYLRIVVRWHAVEIIRAALQEDLMPVTGDDRFGLAGILVGLCRLHGAEAEGESLLQSMIELHPFGDKSNPAINTLLKYWEHSPKALFRILAGNLPDMNPAAMGNSALNSVLERASKEVDKYPQARALLIAALESVFGVWGENQALVAAETRKAEARRRGNHRDARGQGAGGPRPILRKPKIISMLVCLKAEERTLRIVEYLLLLSLGNKSSKAVDVIAHVVRGFLAQDDDTKAYIEGIWEECWPVAGKVTLLLRLLGLEPLDDEAILQEMVGCVEDVRSTLGRDGVKSLATYIASAYGKLYWSSGNPKTPTDEMRRLIDRLLWHVTPTRQFPATPNPRAGTDVVAFTPGPRKGAGSETEARRYYIAQLALDITNEFVNLDLAKKSDAWIKWAELVERTVVGLKVQTPKRKPSTKRHVDAPATSVKKERKGWRWEEGIDAWVAIGGTPGAKLKKERGHFGRGLFAAFAVEVEHEGDKKNWKDEYKVFDDPPRRKLAWAVEVPDLLHKERQEPSPGTSARSAAGASMEFEQPFFESMTPVDDADAHPSSDDDAASECGAGSLGAGFPGVGSPDVESPTAVRRSPRQKGRGNILRNLEPNIIPHTPEPSSSPSKKRKRAGLPASEVASSTSDADSESDEGEDRVQVRIGVTPKRRRSLRRMINYAESNDENDGERGSGKADGGRVESKDEDEDEEGKEEDEMSEDELSFAAAPTLQVVIVSKKQKQKRQRMHTDGMPPKKPERLYMQMVSIPKRATASVG